MFADLETDKITWLCACERGKPIADPQNTYETKMTKGPPMEIKTIASYTTQATQRLEASSSQTIKPQKASSESGAGKISDQVNLSREAQEMTRAKKTANNESPIRADKVNQLKKMIADGTYEINPEKIAQKMFEELF